LYGEDHLLTATIRGEMAWALMEVGRPAEAEKSARMAIAYWRKLPDQTILLGAPQSLSFILRREKRYPESVAVLREELAAVRKSVGPENYMIVNTLDNLGSELLDVNGDKEAESILSEALRQSRKFLPRYDTGRAHIYRSLLRIAARRNDWDGQLNLARRFVAESKNVPQPDSRDIRSACAVLAGALIEQAERFAKSDPSRALALLDELEKSEDFEPEVKAAGGWIDCLRGLALRGDPANQDAASALLAGGLEAMKKKEKPTEEEVKRIRKMEAFAGG
jgi:tetratricopeptide (TPR) repeat protein